MERKNNMDLLKKPQVAPESTQDPDVASILRTEWEKWKEVPKLLQAAGLYCQEQDEDVLVIGPLDYRPGRTENRYQLVMTSVIHGVEVAGLPVLNELAGYIAMQPKLINAPIVLAIGNRAAALRGTRFVERDLNRSFDRKQSELLEERRAKVLEKYMKDAAFYLDFHQTTEPTATPFFIFPYEKRSIEFASSLDPRIPIVSHWGKPFSVEGCCSDEYVQKLGGVGITLELGQNGFHPYHVGIGVLIAWRALLLTCHQQRLASQDPPRFFTWSEVKPYPEGNVHLREGLYNFKEVKQGEELGVVDGKPLVASADGMILFPKYLRDPNPNQPRPMELYRIIKPVPADEMGVI